MRIKDTWEDAVLLKVRHTKGRVFLLLFSHVTPLGELDTLFNLAVSACLFYCSNSTKQIIRFIVLSRGNTSYFCRFNDFLGMY